MTRDIEKGPWKRVEFAPSCHDHTFFFDEDGRNYLIYGNGKLFIAELEADLSGLKPVRNGCCWRMPVLRQAVILCWGQKARNCSR